MNMKLLFISILLSLTLPVWAMDPPSQPQIPPETEESDEEPEKLESFECFKKKLQGLADFYYSEKNKLDKMLEAQPDNHKDYKKGLKELSETCEHRENKLFVERAGVYSAHASYEHKQKLKVRPQDKALYEKLAILLNDNPWLKSDEQLGDIGQSELDHKTLARQAYRHACYGCLKIIGDMLFEGKGFKKDQEAGWYFICFVEKYRFQSDYADLKKYYNEGDKVLAKFIANTIFGYFLTSHYNKEFDFYLENRAQIDAILYNQTPNF